MEVSAATSAIPKPASPLEASAIPSIPPPPLHRENDPSTAEETKHSYPQDTEEATSAALSMIGDILKEEEEAPSTMDAPSIARSCSVPFVESSISPAVGSNPSFSPSPDFRQPTYPSQSSMGVKPTPLIGQAPKGSQQQMFNEDDHFASLKPPPQSLELQKKDGR